MNEERSAILIATLSEFGLEGFEENENALTAYGKNNVIHNAVIESYLNEENITFKRSVVDEENWNAVWESNFDPVEVDDFVFIRADFHSSKKAFEHEVLITPKMSFGTGHHATTYSVMKMMKQIDFTNKTVCDYGTGTGILAILAEKLGAASVLAIDNDNWSIENAIENIEKNDCTKINIEKAEKIDSQEPFDIILANINRNVLLENMQIIAGLVKPGGDILLSGFYEEDVPVLMEPAILNSLELIESAIKNKWVCLHLKKLRL